MTSNTGLPTPSPSRSSETWKRKLRLGRDTRVRARALTSKMGDAYASDDPMLAVDADATPLPLTPSPSWVVHCLKLLPYLCKFHCRTCCACIAEMDCRAGLLVLLPPCATLLGAVLGAGLASGLVFRTGWYDNYGWHDARETALPFAVSASVMALLLGFYHQRPLYFVRVQRSPPTRCGCACNPQRIVSAATTLNLPRGVTRCGSGIPSRAARRGRLGCGGRCSYDCLPVLTFLVGLAFGLWSVFLFSINIPLASLPSCLVVLYAGATTKFSRSRLRRFVRIWCGRTTYEIIVDANPFSRDVESEEDEMEWRETSGSSSDDDYEMGHDSDTFSSSTSSDADDEISDSGNSDVEEGYGSGDSARGDEFVVDDDNSMGSEYESDKTDEASAITILSGGVAQNKQKARKRGVPELV